MVRVCEVTYDKALLEKDGITVVVRLCGAAARAAGGLPVLGGASVWLDEARRLPAGMVVPDYTCVRTHLGEAQPRAL